MRILILALALAIACLILMNVVVTQRFEIQDLTKQIRKSCYYDEKNKHV